MQLYIKRLRLSLEKLSPFSILEMYQCAKKNFQNVEFYVLQRMNDSLHICN